MSMANMSKRRKISKAIMFSEWKYRTTKMSKPLRIFKIIDVY